MNRLCSLAFAMAAIASHAMGQAARTATLVGTVVDPGGAIIVNAKIVLMNTETAIASNGVTNQEGGYYIPFLPVGAYELTVESPGFKKFVQKGIQLSAGEVPRIDVKLEVGAVTESVQVTGGAPMLETETSQVTQTLDARQLNQIPILQMKAQRVLYYMVGVQSRGANSSVVGQSSSQLGFTLDGISGKTSVRDQIGDTNTSVQPDVDALAEAKTYSTGAPAEMGHAAGGIIAFTFKSGTNRLHASAEDRYLNKSMVHRHFLEQLPRNNPFTFHQMMGTISGPVVIPKLYDGRNRTFFLFGYGRHHEKANDPQTQTVPDLNMLSGNFSFPQAAGGGFPIYDPRSMVQSGTTWTSSPFPGNMIPRDRFDPVAANFLALEPWKAANNEAAATYTRNGPSNNWTGYTTYRSYRSRYDSKLDHQISQNNKFFVRNSFNRHRQTGRVTASLNNLLLDSAGFGFGRPQPIDQQNWAFADYHTFSPTLLNEVRLGFNRRVSEISPPTANQGWAQKLGIPNVGPENFPTFATGTANNQQNLFGVAPGAYSRDINEDMTFQNNVTRVMGKHTIKFGYEMIRTRENNIASVNPSGSYIFGTGGTALPFVNNTGNTFASFLLGAPNSASFTQLLANTLPRWWSHAGYIQTDWKPFRTVTLNLGLRYSFETPFQTKWGQKSQFDPNGIDSLTGLPGAITHPTGSVYKADRNNFQPRVGLAWNVKPTIVFRGSFGMFTQDLLPNGGAQEYTASANINQAAGDPRPAFYLSQGPPARNFAIRPDGTSPFLATSGNYSGRSITYLDPNLRVPYVMNWSAGVQIDLGGNWMHELMYQGSAGVGLNGTRNINQIPKWIYDSTDLTLLNAVANATQNYRPYTNFGDINMISNFGHNTYHGLVARIEKRYSSGLTLNSHWTWSKNLSGEAGDGWQYYNWNLTKARTNFDTRHRIIMMANYDLPVGSGRAFLNQGGWTNHVLGGWNLSFIYTVLSGPPITFSYSGNTARYLPGPSRPHQISPGAKVEDWDMGPHRFPTVAQSPLFNMDAFAYPAQFTPGSLGAGTESGLWLAWPQWTLSKSWMIRELVKFSVRLDGNNIPVRRQFVSPNTAVNFANPQNFGRFAPGGTNFSTQGTDNGHFIFGARLEF